MSKETYRVTQSNSWFMNDAVYDTLHLDSGSTDIVGVDGNELFSPSGQIINVICGQWLPIEDTGRLQDGVSNAGGRYCGDAVCLVVFDGCVEISRVEGEVKWEGKEAKWGRCQAYRLESNHVDEADCTRPPTLEARYFTYTRRNELMIAGQRRPTCPSPPSLPC